MSGALLDTVAAEAWSTGLDATEDDTVATTGCGLGVITGVDFTASVLGSGAVEFTAEIVSAAGM